MKCTTCGASIPENALFCTVCGAKVQPQQQPKPMQTKPAQICRQCGAVIPEGNLFCTACGAKAQPQQQPRPAAVPRPGKTCPVCGKPVAEGYTFCISCGTPLNAKTQTAPAPEPQRPAPMTVCRSCGASVPVGSKRCTACGADLHAASQREPERKSRTGLIIGILCAILAAIGIFAVLFFTGALDGLLGVKADKTEDAAVPAEVQTETQTETESEPEAATPSPSPSEAPSPSPTPTPEAEEPEEPDYLLPDSSTRRITEEDLRDLSWRELCLARNEIFARHGRTFETPEIAAYFNGKDWYDGRYGDVSLSSLEAENVNFILSYEIQHYGRSYY